MAYIEYSIDANYYYYGAIELGRDRKGREGENINTKNIGGSQGKEKSEKEVTMKRKSNIGVE